MRTGSAVLAAILLACLLAPLYASRVSGTDPFRSNVNGTAAGQEVLAENTAGLGLGVTPIGPTWRGPYLLGADTQGRDVAARLLYGGRTSLLIAGCATVLCLVLAVVLGAPLTIDADAFKTAGGDIESKLRLICETVHAYGDVGPG